MCDVREFLEPKGRIIRITHLIFSEKERSRSTDIIIGGVFKYLGTVLGGAILPSLSWCASPWGHYRLAVVGGAGGGEGDGEGRMPTGLPAAEGVEARVRMLEVGSAREGWLRPPSPPLIPWVPLSVWDLTKRNTQ